VACTMYQAQAGPARADQLCLSCVQMKVEGVEHRSPAWQQIACSPPPPLATNISPSTRQAGGLKHSTAQSTAMCVWCACLT
jgi:hypothetical protein